MTNRIRKRTVFYISARISSPICISNGEGILTDQDVIRDYDGNPFIPGSSLTGAMRSYLGVLQDEKCIFGYSDMEKNVGEMSSVFVSDFTFDTPTILKIRDGVALSEEKTAKTGAKFDMEVIETGAEGHFFMELVIRERDNEPEMLKQLQKVFGGWKKQEIRLGAKKTRGYGELEILSIRNKTFTKDNILEYTDVYRMERIEKDWPEVTKEWMKAVCDEDSEYLRIEVPLKLTGGISIRQYAAKKGEPDFVQLTIGQGKDQKAVIPGTSFAGAIRHRMSEMLRDIGEDGETGRKRLDAIWGYVKSDSSKQQSESDKSADEEPMASQSAIVIDECILEDASPLTMVRNGISRFEAATKNGALFKERSYVGGTTTLVIHIKKQKQEEEKEMLAMLLPVIEDIRNGYLPVGGQTAVGRGIFQENGRIKVDGEELEERND